MVNGTNASAPDYGYEYYLDYLDLVLVDERKLRAHKRSDRTYPDAKALKPRLVLMVKSTSICRNLARPYGTSPMFWRLNPGGRIGIRTLGRGGAERKEADAIAIAFWVSLVAFVLLLLLVLLYVSWSSSPKARNHTQYQPACPGGLCLDLPLRVLRHLLFHRAPQGTPQAPPSSIKELQQLRQEGPTPSTPTAPQASPALLWERTLSGDPMVSPDVGHKPSWPPPGDGTDASKPRPLPRGL